jgi:two-component system CheB/CheR fusion protein
MVVTWSIKISGICAFSQLHNFLKDPPFGNLDLISCRNVLIYMEPYLQKKALTTFHYALNPKGVLVLGKSETVSNVPELFHTGQYSSEKIFIRKDGPGKFMHVATQRNEQKYSHPVPTEIHRVDFQKAADEIILSKYTPAGVIINEGMDILHFRGSTSDFLEQMTGKPSHNLLKLARNGLSFELRNLIHKAKKNKSPETKENIPLEIGGNSCSITIEVIPLPNLVEPHYLVLFHDHTRVTKPDVVKTKDNRQEKLGAPELRVQQLEKELSQLREDMRSISEDQETTNEELQSANEELLSSSEELQSLNEELETGKEELQSTNEELIVVNQELMGLLEQLKQEKEYAQSIISTMRDPLIVLDKNLRVKTTNLSYLNTFRVTEAETEGKMIYELSNSQWNIPELRELLEKVLPEQTKFNDFEIRQSFSKIGDRVMLLNARELKDYSNEKLILLSIEDVTEREQVLEHKKLKEELEKAIIQRTGELSTANQELEEKNYELLKANKELQSFAYAASHDLQEPLRKIQAFATRLLEKETQNLTEEGVDYFNRMQAAAARMQSLIEDLLAFSRVNNVERQFEIVDLKDMVEDVKKDFKDKIEETKAEVNTPASCKVKVIPFQLKQLIQNLLSNSLKFQKKGNKPNVNISCVIVNSDELNINGLIPHKDYCHITVKDNGIGFEQHFSEKIFEVFQRLHGKEEYDGTGIGLAIVKKIVENHNGIITATSELGKGATFDIYFPVT